jgi:hypothetical protein
MNDSPKKELYAFDVTVSDLESWLKVKGLAQVLAVLSKHWNGFEDPEYLNRIRIGSVFMSVDAEGGLHLDLIPRFKATPELLAELDQAIVEGTGLTMEQLQEGRALDEVMERRLHARKA